MYRAPDVVESAHELSGRQPQQAGSIHAAVHGLNCAAVLLAQIRYRSTVIGLSRNGVSDAAAASALAALGIKVMRPTVSAVGHGKILRLMASKNQAKRSRMLCGSCIEFASKLNGICLDVPWKLSRKSMEAVWNLSGNSMEAT